MQKFDLEISFGGYSALGYGAAIGQLGSRAGLDLWHILLIQSICFFIFMYAIFGPMERIKKKLLKS